MAKDQCVLARHAQRWEQHCIDCGGPQLLINRLSVTALKDILPAAVDSAFVWLSFITKAGCSQQFPLLTSRNAQGGFLPFLVNYHENWGLHRVMNAVKGGGRECFSF